MSNEELDNHDQDDANDSIEDVTADNGDGSFIATEEKKSISKGTLGMFLLLAGAGVATYMMYVRSGPQTAAAATDPQAQQVIKQFMSDRDKNLVMMQKMLQDTSGFVKQFLTYPSVQQIPLTDLHTNPFRIASAKEGDAAPRKDEEKEKKLREEERVAVLKAVQALQLQSVIVSGNRKACMINNSLYTEGQQIDTFSIEKIAPNSVIVRQGSYRFELRMQR